MSPKNTFILTAACLGLACSANVDTEPEPDIPADIYQENVWDRVEPNVRVAALRRDVRAEIRALSNLSAADREAHAGRLRKLLSVLRTEWATQDGDLDRYAQLEQEVESLLEE